MVWRRVSNLGGFEMPVYVYVCQGEQGCGDTREVLFSSFTKRRDFLICGCGRVMTRALSEEGFSVRPDMQPGYNESIGMHVTSRRDFRDKLRYLNAYSPDIPNGDPSGGLMPEERRELEASTRTSRTGNTIFEKRRLAGWGGQPADSNDGITVEGTADYSEIKEAIKKRHVVPTKEVVEERRRRYAGRGG